MHLRKRHLDPGNFDFDSIVAGSEGFSGAELEQVIVSSRYTAEANDDKVTTQYILEEIKQIRPLSVVMAEEIEKLRAWAKNRTVNVH